MRLTTRKTDAFTSTEEEMLTLVGSLGTAWFPPDIARDRREAMKELQRLGHIFPAHRGKPHGGPKGTTGFTITDTGRAALAEVKRRAGTS